MAKYNSAKVIAMTVRLCRQQQPPLAENGVETRIERFGQDVILPKESALRGYASNTTCVAPVLAKSASAFTAAISIGCVMRLARASKARRER